MLVATLAPDVDRLCDVVTGCDESTGVTLSPLNFSRTGDFGFEASLGRTNVGEGGGDEPEPEPEPNEPWSEDPGFSAMRSDMDPGMGGNTLLLVEGRLFVGDGVERADGRVDGGGRDLSVDSMSR